MTAPRCTFVILVIVRVLLFTGTATAAAPEITSDTVAQLYDVRSPTGETVIPRRRFLTTLGVGVYDLVDHPEVPNGPTLLFRARLRYDADYGGTAGETEVTNYGRLVPSFDRGPIDVMYGYLDGRRFLGGWLGFRLGRQYVVDSLGWWSFDGGLVRVTSPYFVAAEVYGGLEQRGGMPVSTSRYERDGIWRGDRTGYDPALWPVFQGNEIAPAYGAAVESTGLSWLHTRLTYRRVDNTGTSVVAPLANTTRTTKTYTGTRISQERLGASLEATLPSVGGIKGGYVYDLYAARTGNLFASVDGYVSRRVTVSADYDYYVPTFDGDSIFNFFLTAPMNDLSLRANWDATDHISISGGVRGRVFQVDTQDADTNALDPMGGGNFSARYRFGEGMLGARSAGDFTSTGDRVGIDLYGERTLETRYVFQGRAGVWQWDDNLRPDRDAVSFQYVLGAGYKVLPRSLAFAEFEHDMNRISGQRFRLMLWLALAVTP